MQKRLKLSDTSDESWKFSTPLQAYKSRSEIVGILRVIFGYFGVKLWSLCRLSKYLWESLK